MARLRGPWQNRVSFAPDGGLAYRPGEALVRSADLVDAAVVLWEHVKPGTAATEELKDLEQNLREAVEKLLACKRLTENEEAAARRRTPESPVSKQAPQPKSPEDRQAHCDEEKKDFKKKYEEAFPGTDVSFPEFVLNDSFVRFKGVSDTLEAIAKLNQSGIYAQPNHVLFAHSSLGDGGFQANPFYANPFYANPFYANPFYANPFYANPFYANPFYANPFYANPFYANRNPAADPSIRETGRRPSSARPAEPRKDEFEKGKGKPVIAILDTGYSAVGEIPDKLKPGNLDVNKTSFVDIPDVDNQGYLDPVAGHGTFIAGIIEQLTPGCKIEVHKVLESYGDGDEVVVGDKLLALAERGETENEELLVNMSFGGYSSIGMGALAEAIAQLHHTGATIVASAGNDGTSLPMYPAVLPHVVAVGALDHEGAPAPFTNFGPWVRACTRGVEIVSTFFEFDGPHPVQGDVQVDEFEGWAVWSGTSFAAPRVVAKLARLVRSGQMNGHVAVEQLLEAPELPRKTLLGTVVDIE